MRNDHEDRTSRLAQSYAQACAGSSAEKANENPTLRAPPRNVTSTPMSVNQPTIRWALPWRFARVALLLGCSIWTVRQRHLRCGLPFFRIGTTGRLLFLPQAGSCSGFCTTKKRKGGESE